MFKLSWIWWEELMSICFTFIHLWMLLCFLAQDDPNFAYTSMVPDLESDIFSEKSWIFLLGYDIIKINIWALGVLISTGGPLLLGAY